MNEHLEINVGGDPTAIGEAKDAIEAFCARRSLPEGITLRLSLAVDELLANVLNHGGAETGAVPDIRLRVRLEHDQLVTELSDSGQPFNPLDAPPPEFDLDLDDKPIGGLGIHLVRQLMDDMQYRREGAYNRVTLRQRLSPAA
ncbi:MAG: ATP-binding protein [Candidatus Competibacter sp.]